VKTSKQAELDAKAKVKAEWVIVKELRNRRSNMAEMEIKIARLTEERDEARRIACELKTPVQQGRYSFAIIMGWDCYEKETP